MGRVFYVNEPGADRKEPASLGHRDLRRGRACSSLGAKSTHQINDQADQQDQSQPTTADRRTANIKTAAAEQEEKYDNKE